MDEKGVFKAENQKEDVLELPLIGIHYIEQGFVHLISNFTK